MTSVTSNPQRAEHPILLRARSVAVAALLIWMAIVWWHFGRTIIRFYSPLPYFDYWNTVAKIDDYRRLHIGVLWQQHSEHRIVFPEIIFAADYILFRGREILPIVLNILLYFGAWLIFSVTLYRNRQLPRWIRQCAILCAGIVMGWQGGAFLIGAAFLIQWSLLLAAALLALFLLTHVPNSRHSWMYLTGAGACCVVCSYTSANGLLVWPVILLAAWILRLSKAQLAALALSALTAIGLYFVDYHFASQGASLAPLAHPFYALSFAAAYLGMPFTVFGPRLGVLLGFLEIAVFFALVAVAFKRRSPESAGAMILLGFYLFCLLTAGATAAGRMNPQDSSYIAATAHRYIIVPLTAHAALILAIVFLHGASRRYLWFSLIVIFTLCFALSGRSRRIRGWYAFAENSLANCQLASLAFESGVDDPVLMATVFPGAEMVKQSLPILRRNHLSSFANGNTERLGRPASSIFQTVISDAREAGAVTLSYPVESGLMVLGWTDSPRRIWHPQELVFLNEQKRIVGFGRKLPGGLPAGIASPDTPSSLAWAGFINLDFQSKSFLPYVVEGHGKGLVPIGKPTVVPPVRVVHDNQVGGALPSIRWDVQRNWIKNGSLPGPAPSISYYDSYSSAAGNTGTLLSAPFTTASGNCLALASAHGSNVEGLSVRLIDADTNVTIASVPLVDRYTGWSFWAITLPPDAHHLQIAAEDGGRGLEQWLAVSEPYSCK